MSKHLVQFDLIMNTTQTEALLNKSSLDSKEFLEALENLVAGIQGGAMDASVNVKLGAAYAQITGTFTGNPSNGETISIGGQTVTAVTSGATANQFNIGSGATANAAACVAAINASATLSLWVVASNLAGVMTIRALIPGSMGNAITLADSMSNFTWAGSATRLATGAQDTNVTYTCGLVAEST